MLLTLYALFVIVFELICWIIRTCHQRWSSPSLATVAPEPVNEAQMVPV